MEKLCNQIINDYKRIYTNRLNQYAIRFNLPDLFVDYALFWEQSDFGIKMQTLQLLKDTHLSNGSKHRIPIYSAWNFFIQHLKETTACC